MNLIYDAELLEGIVFLEARRLERNGQGLLAKRYERDRLRAYEQTDSDARDTAFFQLHLKWFRDLALEGRLLDAVRRFPIIQQTATTLLIRKSITHKDEGAELFVRPDAKNVAIALCSERFFEPGFGQWLGHELCHISDMLDPAFGYAPEITLLDAPPAELNLLRERYRVLWDITIDGRLKHESEKAKRRAECAKALATVSADRFEKLWNGPRPSHVELVALAQSVRVVVANEPGGPCPLCKFPTFAWATTGDFSEAIIAGIQQDFPRWLPAHGACLRCVELYSTRQLEQPATLYI
jgi:hypothetical protein